MTEATNRLTNAGSRRFPPYPEYRNSGVKWLGKIPAHWDVRRLKTIASVRLSNVDKHSEEGQVAVKLCNYVDVYYNDRVTADLDFMSATATREQVRRFLLRVGDVLITKDSESWNDIAVPAVVGEDLSDVLCGYHLAHITPGADLDGRFLARQFSAIGTRDQFYVAANGITRFGLGGDAIRTGVFPVAPIEEQRAIADFLDRETAKIDALVARKERLIELLQEKRTALIARAVTRGLDPGVPMKASGVEWLGEIPAHWEVIPFGRLIARIEQGWSPVAEDRSAAEDEWGVIKLSAVNKGNFRQDEHKSLPSDVRADARYEIREDDFLLTRSNTPDLVGDVCVVGAVRSRLMLCDLVYRLDLVREKVHRDFLAYWFLSRIGRQQIRVEARGSSQSMVKVSQGIIRAWTVVMPSLDEQRVVSVFLARKTAGIDALIAKIHEAIDKLREFRTTLISAAVTGKIDVREAAPR